MTVRRERLLFWFLFEHEPGLGWLQAAHDPRLPALGAEVGPAQGEQFSAPHPGRERERAGQLVHRPGGGGEQPLEQRRIGNQRRRAARPGRLRAGRRVGGQQLPAHRLAKRLGQDEVQVEHRSRRQRPPPRPAGEQAPVQILHMQRPQRRQLQRPQHRQRMPAHQHLIPLEGHPPHPPPHMRQPSRQKPANRPTRRQRATVSR
jgi:hypothetical protein